MILGIQKQPGANTLRLTKELDAVLDDIAAKLPAGMAIDKRIFRQADFIQIAIHNVQSALRDGGLGLVVADVSGHGAAVSETAGKLRSLMRRYVNYIDHDPYPTMNALRERAPVQKGFMRELGNSHDYQEGVGAFREKRKPVWTNK